MAMLDGMDRKERALVAMTVAVVVIVVFAVLWYYVIPRADLFVRTVYHEGSNNAIHVNSKVKNQGTVDIEGLTITIVVTNGTHDFVDEVTGVGGLSPGDSRELKTHFFGDQWVQYTIIVTVDFDSNDEHFSRTFTYTTGDYMNEVHEDHVNKVFL